jgi:hypothetical protein
MLMVVASGPLVPDKLWPVLEHAGPSNTQRLLLC